MCGAAGIGWQEEDEVDYDLDEQDRQWLTAFNHGQERLPFRRMELLLWRLDTANAEATDSAFASKSLLQSSCYSPHIHCISALTIKICNCPSCKHMQLFASIHVKSRTAVMGMENKHQQVVYLLQHRYMASDGHTVFSVCAHGSYCLSAGAGASVAERTSPAACATTDHMSREQAMEALTQVAAARQPVKDAVYHYWLDKRKQLGKPLLRRLQAPTNSSDTNPHSCFRYLLLNGSQHGFNSLQLLPCIAISIPSCLQLFMWLHVSLSSSQLEPSTTSWRVLMLSWLQGA